eukprot:Rhum_TRINITY_DN14298_c3_g3::Rhum_TRINITY_DN14298_c3_g3_i1::g.73208::m.73208
MRRLRVPQHAFVPHLGEDRVQRLLCEQLAQRHRRRDGVDLLREEASRRQRAVDGQALHGDTGGQAPGHDQRRTGGEVRDGVRGQLCLQLPSLVVGDLDVRQTRATGGVEQAQQAGADCGGVGGVERRSGVSATEGGHHLQEEGVAVLAETEGKDARRVLHAWPHLQLHLSHVRHDPVLVVHAAVGDQHQKRQLSRRFRQKDVVRLLHRPCHVRRPARRHRLQRLHGLRHRRRCRLLHPGDHGVLVVEHDDAERVAREARRRLLQVAQRGPKRVLRCRQETARHRPGAVEHEHQAARKRPALLLPQRRRRRRVQQHRQRRRARRGRLPRREALRDEVRRVDRRDGLGGEAAGDLVRRRQVLHKQAGRDLLAGEAVRQAQVLVVPVAARGVQPQVHAWEVRVLRRRRSHLDQRHREQVRLSHRAEADNVARCVADVAQRSLQVRAVAAVRLVQRHHQRVHPRVAVELHRLHVRHAEVNDVAGAQGQRQTDHRRVVLRVAGVACTAGPAAVLRTGFLGLRDHHFVEHLARGSPALHALRVEVQRAAGRRRVLRHRDEELEGAFAGVRGHAEAAPQRHERGVDVHLDVHPKAVQHGALRARVRVAGAACVGAVRRRVPRHATQHGQRRLRPGRGRLVQVRERRGRGRRRRQRQRWRRRGGVGAAVRGRRGRRRRRRRAGRVRHAVGITHCCFFFFCCRTKGVGGGACLSLPNEVQIL